MSENQNVDSNHTESGSTIVGFLSVLFTFFFLYIGSQRIIWTFNLNEYEFLLYGITYLIFASIFIGGAVYGLSSKENGARALVATAGLFGSITFASAGYFWFTGLVLNGETIEVFYALALSAGGAAFLTLAVVTDWIAKRKGVLTTEKSENTDNELAERIEQRGDEINERIEQGGEELDAQIQALPNRIANAIPWDLIVGLGVALWLSLFPLVAYEMELLLSIIIFAAWIAVPFGIYFDSYKFRQKSKKRTWWWVFVLLSFIPIGAILIGSFWLVWRRRFGN